MHPRIQFLLALRASARRFQMPLKGLNFVKSLVTIIYAELFTQQTHSYKYG